MLKLLAAFLLALAPQVRPGSISGAVVRVGTSEPIAKAIVEITGGNGVRVAMATESDGRFDFKNLSPGSYKVTASRNGFLNGAYGQRGPNGQPGTVKLESNQTLKDVSVTMVPTGAISGRVYDISGEPLANASVQAFKYKYAEEGGRSLTSIKGVQTDDRGEYRLFWLPPGKYYISAAPLGAQPNGFVYFPDGGATRVQAFVVDSRGVASHDPKETIAKLGQADVPIYYPGAIDVQDAQALELGPGAEVRADFSLPRVTAHKVRGVVIDGTTGQGVNNANIALISRNGGLRSQARPIAASDGRFEIPDVLPGSYVLSATRRTVDPKSHETVQTVGGQVQVDVSNTDVERVTLVMSPGIDIPGHLIVDGALPLREIGDGNPRPVLGLRNDLPGIGVAGIGNLYSEFTSDTQFVVNRVTEGDYHVEPAYLPKGTYIKSVRFGGVDALNGTIRIEPGVTGSFEMVVGTGSGTIDGFVVDARGERAGSVTVALIPSAPQRQRADLYKNVTTDESGHFHIQGVPPGDYSVFAWEDIENGRWRDPDFIRSIENSGRPVHVADGTQATVEVTAIPFAY
jgi:protocatechuate 3,4-dioxygenase beta subunit